jgi:hypothetical protein
MGEIISVGYEISQKIFWAIMKLENKKTHLKPLLFSLY